MLPFLQRPDSALKLVSEIQERQGRIGFHGYLYEKEWFSGVIELRLTWVKYKSRCAVSAGTAQQLGWIAVLTLSQSAAAIKIPLNAPN